MASITGIGYSTTQNPATGQIKNNGLLPAQLSLQFLNYPNINFQFSDINMTNYQATMVVSYEGNPPYFLIANKDGLFWEILLTGPQIYLSYSGLYNCQNVNGYALFSESGPTSEMDIKKIVENAFKTFRK